MSRFLGDSWGECGRGALSFPSAGAGPGLAQRHGRRRHPVPAEGACRDPCVASPTEHRRLIERCAALRPERDGSRRVPEAVGVEEVADRTADREDGGPARVVARSLVLTRGVDTFRTLGDPVALQAAGGDPVVEPATLDPRVAVGWGARGSAEADRLASYDPA